jgi:hypothetical protein
MQKTFVFALIVFLIILVSGCTESTEITKYSEKSIIDPEIKPTETQENQTQEKKEPEGPCDGFKCLDSEETCQDGFIATCKNKCFDGTCSSCIPSCEGHSVCNCDDGDACTTDTCKDDKCEYTQVSCSSSIEECWDGFIAECGNSCDTQTGCSSCTPSCEGHECEENWNCSSWSSCEASIQTRICTDLNSCGTILNKPPETQGCDGGHLLLSEVYYDTPGKDADEEWVEIHNPTSQDINLSGYSIKDNVGEWDFPGIVISSGGFVAVARNSTGFSNLFNCSPGLDGLTLSLSNSGDHLKLMKDVEEIDYVAWEGEWELEAKTGESLKRSPSDKDTDLPEDWVVEENPNPC